MDDQVTVLNSKGINAVTINSKVGGKEREQIDYNITGYGGITELIKLQELVKKRIYKTFNIPELDSFTEFKTFLKEADFATGEAKKTLHYISKLNLNFEVTEQFSEFKELLVSIQDKQKKGPVKLLYLAPETLLNPSMVEFINTHVKISFIAVDECHIISAWGMSFRPKYKEIAKVRELFKPVPILALTATADAITRKDIIEVLNFDLESNKAVLYSHSVDRPNISYTVTPKAMNQYLQTLGIIKKYPKDTCGIIYCQSRAKCELMEKYLKSEGIDCAFFHAGRKVKDKEYIQSCYMNKTLNLIIATVAFGMGIDRSDVRYVINTDIPNSIEEFSQMSGRASRDGKPADSYLIYSYKDYKWRLGDETTLDPERLKINREKLHQVSNYCTLVKTCRRKFLLEYFGDTSPEYCYNCDICNNKNGKSKHNSIKR